MFYVICINDQRSGERNCNAICFDHIVVFYLASPHPDANISPPSERYLPFLEQMEETRLMDHNDLFVLDFAPSLKTLSIRNVIEHQLNIEALPESIRQVHQRWALNRWVI